MESNLRLEAEFEAQCVRPRPGATLIVGSKLYDGREDRRLRYESAVGVDMLPGDGVDLVLNLEEPLPKGLGKFDHIECLSVLEHSRRPWKLAANLQRLLVDGGTLHLSAPFVWRVHAYPHDYFRYTKEGVRSLFERISWAHLCYAHTKLKHNDLQSVEEIDGHPYFARCEVMGFGVKAA